LTMASRLVEPRWVERWWRGEAGWTGAALWGALAPAEALYALGIRLRGVAYDRHWIGSYDAGVPVISIGNIAVGGTGKTPVTRWVAGECRRRGAHPAILHGGYGGGDEAALHRRWGSAPLVFEGRDRVASARAAVAAGATVLILDDGFQHRRLRRDLDLVLIAAESWEPRPRLLPRGPWREPPSALRRAGAIAVTRRVVPPSVAEAVRDDLRRIQPAAVVLGLRLEPRGWTLLGPPEEGDPGVSGPSGEVVALAAIARPDWFVENARAAGATIGDIVAFPDHHTYGDDDIERILRLAGERPIVTTAKDAVKLQALAARTEVWILEQHVVPEHGAESFGELLDGLLT